MNTFVLNILTTIFANINLKKLFFENGFYFLFVLFIFTLSQIIYCITNYCIIYYSYYYY